MSRTPCLFPPSWASGFGVDAYGVWAELTFNGVTQRLRWIVPGSFLMGAPEGETDARKGEMPRHRVTLTHGYWLADTTCTQAFWLAVVGGQNPSRFKGEPMCPVECVSWDDITNNFLPALQSALRDSDRALLPSEAEWEYGCRAGTATPFNIGNSIAPQQVNYNDFSPVGGQKGFDRGRTIPVGSLPPNQWGLFEMHGNVWEWCRDGPRAYGEDVVDPEGSTERGCALRGGSWFDREWRARSAFRIAALVSLRSGYFGFRWSLRSMSQDR